MGVLIVNGPPSARRSLIVFFFLVTGEAPPSPTAVDDTCKGVGRILRVVGGQAVVDVGTIKPEEMGNKDNRKKTFISVTRCQRRFRTLLCNNGSKK